MRVSRNEIETLVCRAAQGQGWSYSLSLEVGRAAAWVLQYRPGSEATVLSALAARPKTAVATQCPGGWCFPGGAVIAAAPFVFDLLELDSTGSITLETCDSPDLLLGYAGIAARTYAASYEIVTGTFRAAIAQGTLRVAAQAEGPESPVPESPIFVTRLSDAEAPQDGIRAKGIDIAQSAWDTLHKLAVRSFVPATEASRLSGAGAGLQDND